MMNAASERVPSPSPPSPSGFVTHSVFWSGPGLKAVATRVTMPVVPATQPTKRHRGLGGAPVGNSSGTKLNSANQDRNPGPVLDPERDLRRGVGAGVAERGVPVKSVAQHQDSQAQRGHPEQPANRVTRTPGGHDRARTREDGEGHGLENGEGDAPARHLVVERRTGRARIGGAARVRVGDRKYQAREEDGGGQPEEQPGE